MFERIGRLGDRLLTQIVPQIDASAHHCYRQWSGPACRTCCQFVVGTRCGSWGYRECPPCNCGGPDHS